MVLDQLLSRLTDRLACAEHAIPRSVGRAGQYLRSQGYRKRWVDQYLDSAALVLAANGAYLWVADRTIDAIAKQGEQQSGWAMLAAYGGLAAGAVFANEHLIIPVAKGLHRYHAQRHGQGMSAGLGSWLKTGVIAGALFAGANAGDVVGIMQRFRDDAQHAFSNRAKYAAEPETTGEGEVERVMPEYPVKGNGGPAVTGPLEGRKFGGLFADLTGIYGTAPKTINIDFRAQLEKLWGEKIRKYPSNPVIAQTAGELLGEYRARKPSTITLDDYLGEVEEAMNDVRQNLDWGVVSRRKKLTAGEMNLLRDITNALTPNDLIAYALTELMPGTDGMLNKAVLDFLLRNAGREYVEAIPALYDAKTSFGLYQFTEFALYDIDGRMGEERGASVINLALPPEHRIHGSVRFLRGNEHHKAALLFAVDNLATLIRKTDRRELRVLEEEWRGNRDDLVEYIATAHHLPARAVRAARLWLSNGAAEDYEVSCSRKLAVYANKSEQNRKAMYDGDMPEPIRRAAEPQGEPFLFRRKNSQGYHTFRHEVRTGENCSAIAEQFNIWDREHGDRYLPVDARRIVNRDGATVRDLMPNQRVYVLAEPKR